MALCCQSPPSPLKVRGGWVAHEILLSALGLFRFSILDSQSHSQSQSQSLDNFIILSTDHHDDLKEPKILCFVLPASRFYWASGVWASLPSISRWLLTSCWKCSSHPQCKNCREFPEQKKFLITKSPTILFYLYFLFRVVFKEFVGIWDHRNDYNRQADPPRHSLWNIIVRPK